MTTLRIPIEKNYCKKCGSKLADTECGYFDEYTGEKVHLKGSLKFNSIGLIVPVLAPTKNVKIIVISGGTSIGIFIGGVGRRSVKIVDIFHK